MSNADTMQSTLLDIRAFVAFMRRERFRSFVIHGAPLGGKSTFARQLAEIESGVYVDVLRLVSEDAELAARVDELDENWLEDLAGKAVSDGASFVVMDEWDFLIPVWGGDIKPLLHRLDRLRLQCPVAWVLTTRKEIEEATLTRADGATRVLELTEIQDL